MEINNLIQSIIPPNDYQHRNGFNNTVIIDRLNENEKAAVENELLKMLEEPAADMLIAETLVYMKSERVLPVLYRFLSENTEATGRLMLASLIFTLNQDSKMIGTAVDAFNEIGKNKDAYFEYRIIPAFYHLIKLQGDGVRKAIEPYTLSDKYLVAYNAKQALGIR